MIRSSQSLFSKYVKLSMNNIKSSSFFTNSKIKLLYNNTYHSTIIRKFSSLGKGYDILGDDSLGSSPRISLKAYGDKIFQVNDIVVNSSIILLPRHFLLWNANTFNDITINNLIMFPLLFPTLEILFIGTGETLPQQLSSDIYEYFRLKGIVIEVSSTSNAASTFNMLNAEGRNVAAALLTLQPLDKQDKMNNINIDDIDKFK